MIPMLTTICTTCDGDGTIGTGGRIGPCEHRHESACPDCGGTGEVEALCVACGRSAVTRQWDGVARVYLCAEHADPDATGEYAVSSETLARVYATSRRCDDDCRPATVYERLEDFREAARIRATDLRQTHPEMEAIQC